MSKKDDLIKERSDYLQYIRFFSRIFPQFQKYSGTKYDIDEQNITEDELNKEIEKLKYIFCDREKILPLKKSYDIREVAIKINEYLSRTAPNNELVEYNFIESLFDLSNVKNKDHYIPINARVAFEYNGKSVLISAKLFFETSQYHLGNAYQSLIISIYYKNILEDLVENFTRDEKEKKSTLLQHNNINLIHHLIIEQIFYNATNSILNFFNFAESFIYTVASNHIDTSEIKDYHYYKLLYLLEEKSNQKDFVKQCIKTINTKNSPGFKTNSEYLNIKKIRDSIVHNNPTHLKNKSGKKVDLYKDYKFYVDSAIKAKIECIKHISDFWNCCYPGITLPTYLDDLDDDKLKKKYISNVINYFSFINQRILNHFAINLESYLIPDLLFKQL